MSERGWDTETIEPEGVPGLVTSGLFLLRFLMTAIALRNLAVGLPPIEQLTREVAFANIKGPPGDGGQDERLKDEGHTEL